MTGTSSWSHDTRHGGAGLLSNRVAMSYIEDGTVLSSSRWPWGMTQLAFGWLDPEQEVRTGECPHDVLVLLEDAAREPINQTRGWHICGFRPWPNTPVRRTAPLRATNSGSEARAFGFPAEQDARGSRRISCSTTSPFTAIFPQTL